MQDTRQITRVKTAGNVVTADNSRHGSIIAHFPWAKPSAKIVIEVDGDHGIDSGGRGLGHNRCRQGLQRIIGGKNSAHLRRMTQA